MSDILGGCDLDIGKQEPDEGKYDVLPLGRNNLMHQDRWELTNRKVAHVKKTLVDLVDTMVNMSL